MIEFVCVVNFVLAYSAYYLYKKMESHKFFGLIVFSFGFANFLCGIFIIGKLIRGL